jgi:hypothetical protein
MLATGCLIPVMLIAVSGRSGWATCGQHASMLGTVAGGAIGAGNGSSFSAYQCKSNLHVLDCRSWSRRPNNLAFFNCKAAH